jgi:hypothetical protein
MKGLDQQREWWRSLTRSGQPGCQVLAYFNTSPMTHTHFGAVNRIDAGRPGTVHPWVEALLRALKEVARSRSVDRAVFTTRSSEYLD